MIWVHQSEIGELWVAGEITLAEADEGGLDRGAGFDTGPIEEGPCFQ